MLELWFPKLSSAVFLFVETSAIFFHFWQNEEYQGFRPKKGKSNRLLIFCIYFQFLQNHLKSGNDGVGPLPVLSCPKEKNV